MDRTNGANSVTVEGKRLFRDRNLGLGTAGTIVDAEWLNSVQEEMLRIIERAGITPDEEVTTQLEAALSRTYGGAVTDVSATGSLTADQAGTVFVNATGGNVTVTLPAANAANGRPQPLSFVRADTSSNTVTIQRAGSDLVEGATSIPLPVGGRMTLRSNGIASWLVESEAAVGRNLDRPGWMRLPGDLIMQWGDAENAATVTLPVAFPTRGLVVLAGDSDDSPAVCSANFATGGPNVTQINLWGIDVNYWLAIGH
jgi:hypothetical protein